MSQLDPLGRALFLDPAIATEMDRPDASKALDVQAVLYHQANMSLGSHCEEKSFEKTPRRYCFAGRATASALSGIDPFCSFPVSIHDVFSTRRNLKLEV